MIQPTVEDKSKYTSQTDHERHIQEESFTQINNLPQLPVESDCGSLYPASGHNQRVQQIASQNVYDTNKRMEQENAELKALLLKSRETITRFSEEKGFTDKMADLWYNNNRDSYFLPAVDISNTRGRHNLQQVRSRRTSLRPQQRCL